MSSIQWYFYSILIYNEKKQDLDTKISLIEYLASFWNSEAVKKIQDRKKSKSQHKIKDDKEFEEFVTSGDYRNNPLIDAVIKIREQEAQGGTKPVVKSDSNRKNSRSKVPDDLSSIYKTLGKFNKGE